MRYKILIVVMMFFSASVWSAENTDTEMTKTLIGKWKFELKMDNVAVKGTSTYNANGRALYVATIFLNEKEITLDAELVWLIKNGVLITETRKSNYPEVLPIGEVDKDTILQLDSRQFIYRNEKGSEFIALRF